MENWVLTILIFHHNSILEGYHKIISQYRLLHHLLGHVLGGCPMCATRDHQRHRNQWVTWFGRVFCPVIFGLWSTLTEATCAVTFPDIPLIAETRYRKRCWDPRCSQLVRMLNWQDETVHRHSATQRCIESSHSSDFSAKYCEVYIAKNNWTIVFEWMLHRALAGLRYSEVS